MTSSQNQLTVNEALTLLQEYSCVQMKVVEFESDHNLLRQAIKLVTSCADHENLGICADNLSQGLEALESYLKALGYTSQLEKLEIDLAAESKEPVYIKFNTQTMSYYIDSYQGSYRGVLISCQSEDDTLVGTYGHFPLDLFES